MKISKSKRQLAQLLIEAGVTQFPKGTGWAAQDRDGWRDGHPFAFYADKPHYNSGSGMWNDKANSDLAIDETYIPTIIPNWHQTVLSRAEFDQIVAETAPDADGWIEWGGGKCPVDEDCMVVCKISGGELWDGGAPTKAMCMGWEHDGFLDIIAYRLHKPEQAEPQYCESVTRSIPEPVTTPTLDQLLQDWRNADDYAKRKQVEADEAAAMREERWQAVQARAGDFGLTICHCGAKREAEPDRVITDWRDLRAGDEVWWSGDKIHQSGEYVVLNIERPDYEGWSSILIGVGGEKVWVNTDDEKWRFIRRP